MVSRGYFPFIPDDTSTMEAESVTFFLGEMHFVKVKKYLGTLNSSKNKNIVHA
jgi:hypothetical protein